MGAQAPHHWDERAVRSTLHSVCSKSTPGESGGQGCCCCHDNPSGRVPRGLGSLPGGRRRGGQGRPLSVASASRAASQKRRGPQSAQLPVPRACARGAPRAGKGWAGRTRSLGYREDNLRAEEPGYACCGSPCGTFYHLGVQMQDSGLFSNSIQTCV